MTSQEPDPRRSGVEWQQAHVTVLNEALVGVPVTEDGRRILAWLAGWDTGTVTSVAELIRCARQHPTGSAS